MNGLNYYVVFFLERIIEPLRARNSPVYYHRKYNRVPTVDECDVDDMVCVYEATDQMNRDRFDMNTTQKIVLYLKFAPFFCC